MTTPDLYMFQPEDDITFAELVEVVAILAISIQGQMFENMPLSDEAKRHFKPREIPRVQPASKIIQ